MSLAQFDQAIEETGKILHNRSDTIVAVVFVLVAIGVLLFLTWKVFDKLDHRQQDREKYEAARSERDRQKIDDLNEFHRNIASRSADQIEVMATALDRISKALEMVAAAASQNEKHLSSLRSVIGCDRRAIVSMIDATEAHRRGESEDAAQSIRQARQHLITAQTTQPPESRGA